MTAPCAASSPRAEAGIGAVAGGSPPGARICRRSSTTMAGGKIAYSVSQAQPVRSSMWNWSRWMNVTASSATPAIRYGAANARPFAHTRSAAHATASVVEAR